MDILIELDLFTKKFYFILDQLKAVLRTVVLPQDMSLKFPTRDKNHTLLTQLQSQHSGVSASVVLEQERVLQATKRRRQN